MYYELGQACVTNWGSFVLLQIRAHVVTNWGSFIITNWKKYRYKLGQLLQIRATVITNRTVITNWGKMYYKLGQVLQINAIITNWDIPHTSKCNSIQQHGILLSDTPKLHHHSLVKLSNPGNFILDF